MSGPRPSGPVRSDRGLDRRALLAAAAAAGLGASALAVPSLALPSPAGRGRRPAARAPGQEDAAAGADADRRRPLRYACKLGMVAVDAPLAERFALVRELGYDGIELDAPGGPAPAEVRAAAEASGLRVHGVVDAIHWRTRLSDPDPAVRREAVDGLAAAVRACDAYGGSSVLLVPGVVDERTSADEVRARSIAGIREVLPLAATLGIRILVENVWNGFLYDPDGDDAQTADAFAAYLDEIGSPWVGAYLDLGNHRRYGRPEAWIRTLGPRVVKLDVKDWSRDAGFCPIGEGDVDWGAVRDALAELRFTGWATAEVAGGSAEHLAGVLARMRAALAG